MKRSSGIAHDTSQIIIIFGNRDHVPGHSVDDNEFPALSTLAVVQSHC